ncbi:MAG: hypothetical protein AAGI15_06800 [Pseudomonadota bacterium]
MSDSVDLNTRGRRPAFFGDGQIDALLTALLESMSQQWATRERVLALQKLLERRGVIEPGELEAFVFDDADTAKLAADQQAFLADAFRAIGGGFQGLSDREQEIDEFQRG